MVELSLNCNGDSAEHNDDEEEEVKLEKEEAAEFRGAAARPNFLSQDSPELMYPAKKICQDNNKIETPNPWNL